MKLGQHSKTEQERLAQQRDKTHKIDVGMQAVIDDCCTCRRANISAPCRLSHTLHAALKRGSSARPAAAPTAKLLLPPTPHVKPLPIPRSAAMLPLHTLLDAKLERVLPPLPLLPLLLPTPFSM
jgi:hypothetical protein